MDTTKKYTKMCEKAPRELWDKVEHCGSFITWRSFIGIVMPDPDKNKWEGLASVIPETLVLRTWLKEGEETILVLKTDINYGGSDGDRGTPLYRQDQLQEILYPFDLPKNTESYGEQCHNLAIHFVRWITHMNWQYIIKLKTMEQLWLALVMKEKYNKMWDNDKEKWMKGK